MKVFLSYSSRDRVDALTARDVLIADGCEVWLDFADIVPSEELLRQLEESIAAVDVLCLLLTPTSVASEWVGKEIELALQHRERGLRILPAILRPCDLPPAIHEITGVDLTDGLEQPYVKLTLARAVRGDAGAYAVALDAAYREFLSQRARLVEAAQALPEVARRLDDVRETAIRDLFISVAAESFSDGGPVAIELRLLLDDLWTQPMRFFFAPYREDATWPAEWGFEERPYSDYFGQVRPRIDGRFVWFDRHERLPLTLHSTSLYPPASFSLRLDGAAFQPKGLHLRQTLEIPSLARLVQDRCRFELIAYDRAGEATAIDPARTDVDIVVTGYFREAGRLHVTLFKSAHSPLERFLLSKPPLNTFVSPIEREAVLALFDRLQPATRRVEQPPEREDDRVRARARKAYEEFALLHLRKQLAAADERLRAGANELAPLVFEQHPGYDDAMLLFHMGRSLVDLFVEIARLDLAAAAVGALVRVGRRLVEVSEDEPDFRTCLAMALTREARIRAELGDHGQAVAALVEAIDIRRELHQRHPNEVRARELRDVLREAVAASERYGWRDAVPLDEWMRALAPGGDLGRAAWRAAVEAGELPVWLDLPAGARTWTTRAFANALLHYSLAVPEHWSALPEVVSTDFELQHVFRGPSREECLFVSFMSHSAGGRLETWFDAMTAMLGFPVIELVSGDKTPRLLSWTQSAAPVVLRERLQVEECLLYEGLALMPDQPTLARMYAVVARRGSHSWKVFLSFMTACFPGTPEEVVRTNDHYRAAATFGKLGFLA